MGDGLGAEEGVGAGDEDGVADGDLSVGDAEDGRRVLGGCIGGAVSRPHLH